MRAATLASLLLLAGCSSLPEGRFEGTGPHARKVKTSSAEAQEWFDQGLNFLFAFNHDEAIRSFERAAAADPGCAMAHWGIAVANGPHINNPMVDEAHAKAAWAALSKARELAVGASPVERELIEALSRRYADPQPADRGPLDRAYADAMREAWKRHGDDADVGALFAEAMMDLRPWDLWTQDRKAQPGTEEIVATLEAVLRLDAKHPLGCHLYIHAVEASAEPGRADAACDALRGLAPGLGHLVHMPSHIDVRRGRWEEAVEANERAIEADARYVARALPPGFYRVYMAHNRHMLAFACMMTGRSKLAADSLAAMLAEMPPDFLEAAAPLVDGFVASPLMADMRFGRWEAVLAAPEPREIFPQSRAYRHFARGCAFAALGKAAEARAAQKEFEAAVAKVPADAFFGNNGAGALFQVASGMLEGEILVAENRLDEGIAMLKAAVAHEDGLRYDEPPDWIMPVRHPLGAALLRAGKAAEAEAVYREDLRQWPGNGWSLYGLAQSLKAQGKDAAQAERDFATAWKHADVEVNSSCLCLPPR